MSDLDLEQMNRDDYESTLRLMVELQDIIRFEELSPEDRLVVLDRALGMAVAGPPEEARDLVRDVLLGRIAP